jgi:hypothetical protein
VGSGPEFQRWVRTMGRLEVKSAAAGSRARKDSLRSGPSGRPCSKARARMRVVAEMVMGPEMMGEVALGTLPSVV